MFIPLALHALHSPSLGVCPGFSFEGVPTTKQFFFGVVRKKGHVLVVLESHLARANSFWSMFFLVPKKVHESLFCTNSRHTEAPHQKTRNSFGPSHPIFPLLRNHVRSNSTLHGVDYDIRLWSAQPELCQMSNLGIHQASTLDDTWQAMSSEVL